MKLEKEESSCRRQGSSSSRAESSHGLIQKQPSHDDAGKESDDTDIMDHHVRDENSLLSEENKRLKEKLVALSKEVSHLRNENMILRNKTTGGIQDKEIHNPGKIASTSSRSMIARHVALLTDVDMLFAGLSYAGFDCERQKRVNLNTNMDRFKAFYGKAPTTLVPMFSDISRRFTEVSYIDLLMTLNWFTLYDTLPVLAGRWGNCEKHIGRRVKECGKMIQSLKQDKIRFEFSDTERVYLASYDTVNFLAEEFRLDPSAKWFDPKSHSSGLKYEFCLSLEEPKIVWANGNAPASYADITYFRGGKVDEGKENWDRNALYFQVPEGKRLIADGGLSGEPTKITIASPLHPKKMRDYISLAKARQETLHTSLKSFNILGHRFRHGTDTEEKMELHKMAVEAIIVIIQYDFENGHPPFDMPY
ncbi:hypothetical protein ACHAXR_006799 [Thalassiosira sp. AJA248-18]